MFKYTWALGVLALACVAFYPLLGADFINLSDNYLLYDNYDVGDFNWAGIANFDLTDTVTYVPLTLLSFAIEHHFFGLNPFVYHLDNILLHLLVGCLLFHLILSLGFDESIAIVAALFFTLHPMHVESVAWIAERKDVLYSSLYLSALLTYVRYLKTKKRPWYLATLLLGLCSILAKPMALSLPLILLLFDWLFKRGLTPRVIIEKIPFVMIMAPIASITFLNINQLSPPQLAPTSVGVWLWSLGFYLGKFFLPINLSPIYPPPAGINTVWGCFVTLDLVFLLWMFRKHTLVIFSFLFYFLSIFFLLRCDTTHFHVVADRFMYLPSAGFCLLGSVMIHRVGKIGWFLRYSLIAMILIVFTFSAMCLSTIWRDAEFLWSYTLKQNPSSTMAHYIRGLSYFDQGRYEFAINDFKVVSLKGYDEQLNLYTKCGDAYIYTDQYALAVLEFRKAVSTYNALGHDDRDWKYKIASHTASALILSKRYADAVDYVTAALTVKEEAWVLNNRGVIQAFIGDKEKAKRDFTRALVLDPGYPQARENLNKL